MFYKFTIKRISSFKRNYNGHLNRSNNHHFISFIPSCLFNDPTILNFYVFDTGNHLVWDVFTRICMFICIEFITPITRDSIRGSILLKIWTLAICDSGEKMYTGNNFSICYVDDMEILICLRCESYDKVEF